MKQILLSSILATVFVISINAQTGLYVPQLARFDAAMLKLMSDYNVPGGQLTITSQGRLVYNRGFGFANTATQDSVYPNSIFRIASVSKTVTAVACMKLFEQGLLNLDAKVFGSGGILNDAIYQNILDPLNTTITVRMLLQHSGGWDRNISGDIMFDAYNIATTMGVVSPPSPSVVIQYVLSHKLLDFTPGTQYQYSNFGFCVLGRIIEKITGQTYADYIQNDILNPLGITDMQLGFNLLANQLPNEVNYYDATYYYSVYNNSTIVPAPYGAFNLEFMDSHGGWVASCEDLLKLVCAFDRFNTRPDILSTATIDTMIQPSVNNPNYGCGIAVNASNNWWHDGSLPGTTSEFVRYGDGQLNWAILLNTRDQAGNINSAVDNLVWNVLQNIIRWPTFDLFTTPTGIDDLYTTNNVIAIYPNPTKSQINFSVQTNVQLINATGQIVTSKKNVNSLDVSNQPTGIYFITFTDDKGQVLQRSKIVKQ
jgi:CubicO group peptidase (beta-lactamase class C family)